MNSGSRNLAKHTVTAYSGAVSPGCTIPSISGSTIAIPGYRLFTLDTRALAHILNNTQVWQKPGMVRRTLASVVGEGVVRHAVPRQYSNLCVRRS